MTSEPDRSLLAATVRVPEHVVYRAFVKETVILNLQTGTYHGVNPTGARMLDVLQRSATIGDAAATLAREYGRPRDEIERDLSEFCASLADRGLIDLSQ